MQSPPVTSTELIDPGDTDSITRPLALTITALVAGLGIEIAVHPWFFNFGRPGLGATVAMVIAGVAITTAGTYVGDRAPTTPAVRLYTLSVGFAALVIFRASPVLTFFNLAASVMLFGGAVATHRSAAGPAATITTLLRTGRDVAFNGAFGALLVAGKDAPDRVANSQPTRVKARLTGVLIAIPVGLVFLLLFLSADSVFDSAVRRMFALDLPDVADQTVVLTIAAGWILLGLMRRAITGPLPPPPKSTRTIGLTEALTFMSIINGIFATFISFQVFEVMASYQTADVSYANQARSGFFELVAVAALVVVLIMVIDWWTRSETAGRSKLYRQHTILIALTTAVLVSAIVRMGLYVEAFGLTELRLYTSVFMIWIAFLMFWLTRTVFAGDRHQFTKPAIGALLATLVLLNVANPDAVIASHNMDHPAQARLDEGYIVAALSADAVPAVLQRLDTVGDVCAQLRLVERIRVPQSDDIRSWNWSRSRANGLLEGVRSELASACPSS